MTPEPPVWPSPQGRIVALLALYGIIVGLNVAADSASGVTDVFTAAIEGGASGLQFAMPLIGIAILGVLAGRISLRALLMLALTLLAGDAGFRSLPLTPAASHAAQTLGTIGWIAASGAFIALATAHLPRAQILLAPLAASVGFAAATWLTTGGIVHLPSERALLILLGASYLALVPFVPGLGREREECSPVAPSPWLRMALVALAASTLGIACERLDGLAPSTVAQSHPTVWLWVPTLDATVDFVLFAAFAALLQGRLGAGLRIAGGVLLIIAIVTWVFPAARFALFFAAYGAAGTVGGLAAYLAARSLPPGRRAFVVIGIAGVAFLPRALVGIEGLYTSLGATLLLVMAVIGLGLALVLPFPLRRERAGEGI